MVTIINSVNRNSETLDAVVSSYQKVLDKLEINWNLLDLSHLPREIAFHFPESTDQSLPDFAPFQQVVDQAEKFIFVVPEYNGGCPGILKLFIDCLEFPNSFRGKEAAFCGISSGMFGNLRGLDQLDSVLNYLQCRTFPNRVHIPRIESQLTEDESLVNELFMAQLELQARDFLS